MKPKPGRGAQIGSHPSIYSQIKRQRDNDNLDVAPQVTTPGASQVMRGVDPLSMTMPSVMVHTARTATSTTI
jgi:hypothetical protein